MVVVAILACVVGDATAAHGAETAVQYNRDIRPILSDNCFACHGPDSASRKADLRLDQREAAVEMGAIVPGDPDESEMIRRIMSDDPEEQMPPPETKKKLTDAQKQLLVRWIAEGAEYQPHWSLIAPVRPAAAEGRATRAWVRNPIDNFVAARLEAAGLTPAPEADRRTLARRVSLDLTGLPPGRRSWSRQFVNDAAPDAYERLVDTLLASPQVGRASRPLLARRRPLRRHARHPLRQLPRDVVVSRLGDRGLQPQHAVRPVHDREPGRRPAAERDARAADRLGLQPLQHHDQRRRRDRGRVRWCSTRATARRRPRRSGWG